MLFISILLSVWFVIWLMYTIFMKDLGKAIMAWLMDMYSDDEEDIDSLLEKSENGVHHLSCPHCNYIWWSIEPNVKYCPNCGKPTEKVVKCK